MDCRYFVYLDSQTVERSVKSLGKEFEARNIGAAILKVNSKLKSSSMRAKLHPLSTQPGFISDICCKEESKVPRKSSQQPIWVKDNPHLWWKTEANIYQPRWKQSLLIIVAKTSSTYMKIFLVGRIIGVPVKWRTCTLLVSLRLHLGFLSCLIFFLSRWAHIFNAKASFFGGYFASYQCNDHLQQRLYDKLWNIHLGRVSWKVWVPEKSCTFHHNCEFWF